MTKKWILFLGYILSSFFISAQDISYKTLDSLQNNSTNLYFDNKNKRYYGCGMSIDCIGLPVVFTNIILDKNKKQITLSGYVNPITTNNGDTIGANIFKLFIAKKVDGKLKKIRLLADVLNIVLKKDKCTEVDEKKLSFSTNFKFSENDFLYIESTELFRLKEYNIGFLLTR